MWTALVQHSAELLAQFCLWSTVATLSELGDCCAGATASPAVDLPGTPRHAPITPSLLTATSSRQLPELLLRGAPHRTLYCLPAIVRPSARPPNPAALLLLLLPLQQADACNHAPPLFSQGSGACSRRGGPRLRGPGPLLLTSHAAAALRRPCRCCGATPGLRMRLTSASASGAAGAAAALINPRTHCTSRSFQLLKQLRRHL